LYLTPRPDERALAKTSTGVETKNQVFFAQKMKKSKKNFTVQKFVLWSYFGIQELKN
jgi:hypothetical protein